MRGLLVMHGAGLKRGRQALCALFECTDPKIVMVALDGIDNILKIGKTDAQKSCGLNSFCEFVEECGGLDSLEACGRRFFSHQVFARVW